MAIHPDDIKAFMRRKVAGVPVYAIALVVAAVVLFMALRLKKTPTPAADPTADTSATGDGSNTDPTQQPDFSASSDNGTNSVGATVTTTQTTDTNDLWRGRVIAWLITQNDTNNSGIQAGHGNLTIEESTTAIDNYLNSEPLDANSTAIRNVAVKQFGFPPEGIPAAADTSTADTVDTGSSNDTGTTDVIGSDNSTTIQPSPAPLPTPISQRPPTKQGTPPCVHVVVNGLDNSAAELAVLYHGSNSADIVNKFHEVNVDTPGGPGGPWNPGTHVNIPSHTTPGYYKATSAVNTAPEIGTKNGISGAQVKELNPGVNFPVKVGTQVRVK